MPHRHHALQFRSRAGGKGFPISYPCVVLNVMVAAHNTNAQYAQLVNTAAKTYATSSRMSIEFEVDGPYKVRVRY
jgi:DNA polymerase epsilon subunit 1